MSGSKLWPPVSFSSSSLLETTSSSVSTALVEMPPGSCLHGPRPARSAGTQEGCISLGTGPRQSQSESFRRVEMDAKRVSSYVSLQRPLSLLSSRGLAENAATGKNDRRENQTDFEELAPAICTSGTLHHKSSHRHSSGISSFSAVVPIGCEFLTIE